MGDLLVRNLPPETLAALKRRAKQHGRSVQAEVVEIIERNVLQERRSIETLFARARAESAGKPGETAAEIVRRDRERDD